MPKPRELPHVLLPVELIRARSEFRAYPSGGGGSRPPPPLGGRPAHAARLGGALDAALTSWRARRAASRVTVEGARPGLTLEVEAFPALDLALQSLEATRGKDPHEHIKLLSTTAAASEDQPAKAVIFVPEGKVKTLLDELKRYGDPKPKPPLTHGKSSERRHEDKYDRIHRLHLATVRALWTDDPTRYPRDPNETVGWEVWLRRTDGRELDRLRALAAQVYLRVGEHGLGFQDRLVVLVFGSAEQLSVSIDVLGDLAELRAPRLTATFFEGLSPAEQVDWVESLRARVQPHAPGAPAVCLLDTGVAEEHPLLRQSITPSDLHTVTPSQPRDDRRGHGTAMAGLALFGDLTDALTSQGPHALEHGLESVKLLPDVSAHDPVHHGAVTAMAAALPETHAPHRTRTFMMAVTTEEGCQSGQPGAWAAAVDALAAGELIDARPEGLINLSEGQALTPRLFVLSAGNVRTFDHDHLSRSDTSPVCDPAQAWNALTVGAHTERDRVIDPTWRGFMPLAARGELSPHSTTGLSFEPEWPIKPEVVMEGGNLAVRAGLSPDTGCAELELLTTHHRVNQRLLTTANATSAAAAQVARLCAKIQAARPELWPETVRALVVHSARHTPQMLDQLGPRLARRLLRRYGFGVPDLTQALHSAQDALTLIVQDEIMPDCSKLSGPELHLHELPWPTAELEALGADRVRLRVTLSYFIHPNPSARGWEGRHRYASHGLRFELRRPTESNDELKKRLNKAALLENEGRPRGAPAERWTVGPQARNRGSLHHDWIEDTAANLARRGVIAVHPAAGWWKGRSGLAPRRVRYALVVSIEAEELDVDLWSPVEAQLRALRLRATPTVTV
jgi:hypothetical protein